MVLSAILHGGKEKMTVISFRSVTAAERARFVLKSRGIFADLVDVDPHLTRRGCTHGLSIPSDAKEEAKRILSKKGIATGDIIG